MGPFRRARVPEPTRPLERPPPDETWAHLCRASRTLRAVKASWGYRETDDIQVPTKVVRPVSVPPLGPPVGSMPIWTVPLSRPPFRPRPRRPPPPLAEAEALSQDEWAIRFAVYGMDFAGPPPVPVATPLGPTLGQAPGVEEVATGAVPQADVVPEAREDLAAPEPGTPPEIPETARPAAQAAPEIPDLEILPDRDLGTCRIKEEDTDWTFSDPAPPQATAPKRRRSRPEPPRGVPSRHPPCPCEPGWM